jgi:hypothetical protein
VTKPSRADMEALIDAARRTFTKMKRSQMCVSIFTEDYERDPVALIQFAAAILLDKPIYLLVPEGRVLAANVRAVAAGIEFYPPGDEAALKAASERLLRKAVTGM